MNILIPQDHFGPRPIPTVGLKRSLSFLDPADRASCSLVCRRFAILILNDPNRKLDQMNQRTALKTNQVVPYEHQGPTYAYLQDRHFIQKEASLKEEINGLRWHMNVIGDHQLNHKLNPVALSRDRDAWLEWERRFDPIVEDAVYNIVKIENQHGGYIPFYHGMSKSSFCFSLFTRELLATPYNDSREFPLTTPLIRFPDPQGIETIREFLEKNYPWDRKKEKKGIVFDHRPEVIKELLPVNPHLFMNLQNANECTWNYFLEDKNVNPPSAAHFFTMLCAEHNLDAEIDTIETLSSLHEKLVDYSKTYMRLIRPEFGLFRRGLILQILIPEPLVEKISYACGECGYLEDFKKNKMKAGIPLLKRLAALKNPEASRDRDLNSDSPNDIFQARLLIQSLFVPNHGIKVFTHGSGDFFSKDPFKRPDKMDDENWAKLQRLEQKKTKVLRKARQIFTSLLLKGISSPLSLK